MEYAWKSFGKQRAKGGEDDRIPAHSDWPDAVSTNNPETDPISQITTRQFNKEESSLNRYAFGDRWSAFYAVFVVVVVGGGKREAKLYQIPTRMPFPIKGVSCDCVVQCSCKQRNG